MALRKMVCVVWDECHEAILRVLTYDWEDWLDPSGKFVYVSPSCEWVTGYRPDEFLDPDLVIRITHPDDRGLVREHFREVLSGSVEIHHIGSGGTY